MADDKNVERKDEPCSDSEEDEAAKILRQKRERGVLSGAGKKRLRWYLVQGYPLEVARTMASLPMSARSDSASNSANLPMLIIVPENYPTDKLESDQSRQIEAAILKAIASIPANGPQVKFNNYSHEPGFVKVMCANEKSQDWLIELVRSMTPWPGAKLKGLAQEKNLYVVWVADSADLAADVFLGLLAKQNDGLNTSTWRVVRSDKDRTENNMKFTISIDDGSIGYLEKMNNKLSFNSGTVELWSMLTIGQNQVRRNIRRKRAGHDKPSSVQGTTAGKDAAKKVRQQDIDNLIMQNLKKLIQPANGGNGRSSRRSNVAVGGGRGGSTRGADAKPTSINSASREIQRRPTRGVVVGRSDTFDRVNRNVSSSGSSDFGRNRNSGGGGGWDSGRNRSNIGGGSDFGQNRNRGGSDIGRNRNTGGATNFGSNRNSIGGGDIGRNRSIGGGDIGSNRNSIGGGDIDFGLNRNIGGGNDFGRNSSSIGTDFVSNSNSGGGGTNRNRIGDRNDFGNNRMANFGGGTGGNRNDFGNNLNDFGNDRNDFGNNRNDFGNNRNDFGNNRNDFGNNRNDFGNNRNDFGNNRDELINNRNELINNRNDLGNNRNDAGNNRNDFGKNLSDFGNNRNDFGNDRNDFGGNNRNDFGNDRNDFGNNRNDFGNSRSNVDNNRSNFGSNRNDFGNSRNDFGNSRNDFGNSRNELTANRSGFGGNGTDFGNSVSGKEFGGLDNSSRNNIGGNSMSDFGNANRNDSFGSNDRNNGGSRQGDMGLNRTGNWVGDIGDNGRNRTGNNSNNQGYWSGQF